MKRISIFCFYILAAALTVGATIVPKMAIASQTTASQTTFESPLPPWCEDNGGQQPCLPWRPTPAPLATSAPMDQSGQDQSPEIQPGAMPATIQPGVMLPATLPIAGGTPSDWLVVIIIIFLFLAWIGAVWIAYRGRRTG